MPTKEFTHIFDEEYVDCNNCEHYHNNTCDAVPVGSERTCTAFKATRKEDIPQQIKSLTNDLREIKMGVVLIYILFILNCIANSLDMIFG